MLSFFGRLRKMTYVGLLGRSSNLSLVSRIFVLSDPETKCLIV